MADNSREAFGAVRTAAPSREQFGAVREEQAPSTAMDVLKSTGQGMLDAGLSVTAALRDGFKLANFPILGQIYGVDAQMQRVADLRQHPENAAAINKNYYDLHHGAPLQKTLYEPQTGAGEYARAGASGATVGLLTSGPAGVIPGYTSGVGGKAGHDLGAKVGFPGTGEVIGSLVGGVAPAAAMAGGGPVARAVFGNNAETAARDAMKGMTDADFIAARDMQQKGNAVGVPLTGAEATGNPQLLGMQRTLEQQPSSAPVISNFMKDRPGQVDTALDKSLVPMGARSADPRLVGADVQAASNEALTTAEQGRTNSVAHDYAIADRQVVSHDAVKNLVARMDAAVAQDTTGTLAPQVAKAKEFLVADPGKAAVRPVRTQDPNSGIYSHTPGTPAVPPRYATDIDNLDRARKAMRDMAELPPFGAEAGAKETSKYLKNFGVQLDGIMKTSKPYSAAVDAFTRASPRVDAKINGTLGALTKTADPHVQWNALVDENLSRSGTVTTAAQDMIRENPEAYRKLVRLGLENEFNEAKAATMNPANEQVVGAKVGKGWFSTPQRMENMREAVSNLPNGGKALDALDNVMTVLRQTGYRQATGSPTASNAANVSALGPPLTVNTVQHPLRGLGQALSDNFTQRSATRLAKILTDPNSVDKLQKIANYNPMEPYARAGIIGVINGTEDQSK